jgi:hypothetical protein
MTLGLGALAMYFLDPEHGRRRRVLLRDQLTRGKALARKRVRELRSEPAPEPPSQTPEGAQHLGR